MSSRNKKTPRKTSVAARKPRVAIYVRVSTLMQADKDSLPMQRKDLVAYASLVLGIEDYKIFEDAGYSGKNMDRPDFQNMMNELRTGEFTHVLVWKIDRISRNLLDFAEMYEELQDLHVTFVSKNEQFDTSSAMGEAMLKIILVFAELERNMTSERVTATMISRANNGLWNGGRVPFGYSWDKKEKLFSIDEGQAKVCLILKDDYLEYKSLVHTARFLNSLGYKTRAGFDWTPSAVWVIVSSPFYAGIYRYNRYHGTERRYVNSEDEWVIIRDHHPAIFSLEEHEAMLSILNDNVRYRSEVGMKYMGQNTHVFAGLAFCGKCGHRLYARPGRVHRDGYRTSTYSCPVSRSSDECDNPAVSDIVIGEFVVNYILNMLNAKTSFSKIETPGALERRLLRGRTFDAVDHIGQDGLNEYFNLLSRYGSDSSYTFVARRPKKKKAPVDPEIESLRKDRERLERAFRRLQDLYLYSDDAMSEKDYIVRKSEILGQLEEVNARLGMAAGSVDRCISDEDFVKQASHLLIQRELRDREYIYYKNLAKSVSAEVLQQYMESIIDSVYIADGHVTKIVFKNGLAHSFVYRQKESPEE